MADGRHSYAHGFAACKKSIPYFGGGYIRCIYEPATTRVLDGEADISQRLDVSRSTHSIRVLRQDNPTYSSHTIVPCIGMGAIAVYGLFMKMNEINNGLFMPRGDNGSKVTAEKSATPSDPGFASFPWQEKELSPMTWREIRNLFKRLDSNLTEAVYLHGCYLTGQEKTIRHSREDEARDHSREQSNAVGNPAPRVTQGTRPARLSMH